MFYLNLRWSPQNNDSHLFVKTRINHIRLLSIYGTPGVAFLVTLPIGANGPYVFYTLPPRLKQRREFIILASDFS